MIAAIVQVGSSAAAVRCRHQPPPAAGIPSLRATCAGQEIGQGQGQEAGPQGGVLVKGGLDMGLYVAVALCAANGLPAAGSRPASSVPAAGHYLATPAYCHFSTPELQENERAAALTMQVKALNESWSAAASDPLGASYPAFTQCVGLRVTIQCVLLRRWRYGSGITTASYVSCASGTSTCARAANRIAPLIATAAHTTAAHPPVFQLPLECRRYSRKGLSAALRFYAAEALPPALLDWALGLTRLHMAVSWLGACTGGAATVTGQTAAGWRIPAGCLPASHQASWVAESTRQRALDQQTSWPYNSPPPWHPLESRSCMKRARGGGGAMPRRQLSWRTRLPATSSPSNSRQQSSQQSSIHSSSRQRQRQREQQSR